MFYKDTSKIVLETKKIKVSNISQLRERVKILIVDDEEFGRVDQLSDRKYSIFYKKDIDYSIEAEPFDIVILDIKGVARKMASPKEGFGMAQDIKKIYPYKKIYCFSGSVIKDDVAESLTDIDGYIPKDNDIDQWAEKLDVIIKDYVSMEYQEKMLRKQLKDISSDKEISDIVNAFSKDVNTHSCKRLYKTLDKIHMEPDDAMRILGLAINLISIWWG